MAEPTAPRLQRAIDVIVRIQRLDKLPAGSVEGFMPHLRKDAELLLESIDGPEPDWADVREAAREAGWSVRTEPVGLRPVETKLWAHYPPGERFPDGSRGWARAAYGRGGACRISVELHAPGREPRSRVDLVDPTPAEVLAAARLIGIGGDRG